MYVGGCKIDAAYLGACKLDKIYLGVCEVLSGVQAVPKWQAFVPDPTTGVMTGLIGGVGQPTNGRTAPINLQNHDDLFGEQNTGVVGYRGGRDVQNLWTNSENISVASRIEPAENGDVAVDSFTVTSNSNNTWYRADRTISGVKPGAAVIVTLTILPSPDCTGTWVLRPLFLAGYPVVAFTPSSVLEPTTIAVSGNYQGGSSAALTIDSRTSVGGSGSNCLGTVNLGHIGVEQRYAGQSTTIPSGIIVTESDPVTKIFATENGNSVDGTGVVTFAKGADLPEMPWAARFPQVTNLAPNCRDLTGAGWVSGNGMQITTDSVIGLDGSFNAATADDQSATQVSYTGADLVPFTAGETGTVIFFIKDDPSYTEWIGVRASSRNVALQLNVVVFNPQTGEVSGALTTATDYDVTLVNGWWRIAISVIDANAGNTYWQCTLYPAYSSDGTTQDNAAEQAIFSDAVQFYEGYGKDAAIALAGAPIYTTSAVVIRDKDDIQLNVMNHDDTGGTYYLEADLSGACNILGDFLQFDGTAVHLINASGTSSVDAAPGVHKIGLVWGQGTMRLNVDGVWGTEVSYNGTLLSGAFDIGRDSAWPVYVRNFPAYDYGDESIIDELMA